MRRLAFIGALLSLALGCAPDPGVDDRLGADADLGVDPGRVDRARIRYTWTGLSGTHARFVELWRVPGGDFEGSGQSVDGGDLRGLLASVRSGTKQSAYANCGASQDDYPSWQISAWTEDDDVMVLESSSNCPDHMPWNVYRGGIHWVVDDAGSDLGPALQRVVERLWPDEPFRQLGGEAGGLIGTRSTSEDLPHNLLGMLPMHSRSLVAHENAGPDFNRGLAFYLAPVVDLQDVLLSPEGRAARSCEVLETDPPYPELYVSCPLDDLPETAPPQGYLRGTLTTEHGTTTLEGRVVDLEWTESPW